MKLLIGFLNKLISTTLGQAIFGIALAKNKRICAELSWMAYRDQKARKAWARSRKYRTVEHLKQAKAIRLDLSHTRRRKQIIAKHGWPGETLVGSMGCQAAWVLVQHADHDAEFQKQCLGLLERALEKNEAPTSCLAYLTDRICVGDGRGQICGTDETAFEHNAFAMKGGNVANIFAAISIAEPIRHFLDFPMFAGRSG